MTAPSPFLAAILDALALPLDRERAVTITGPDILPSAFAVSRLIADSMAAVGLSLGALITPQDEGGPMVSVDQRLAAHWCQRSVSPQGWQMPPLWDAVAGDYQTLDGWIRLHTNAPHHRDAALKVLGVAAERALVAEAVGRWRADDLETAVIAAGGCAAALRDPQAWRQHPQGAAVAAEPLIAWSTMPGEQPARRFGVAGRPLAGIRVLDVTRVLAGPVATRTLAGFGAEVLRIDPPGWDEPGVVPDVTLGKRCARLDLCTADQRGQFAALLADADLLIHGLRPGALDRLGLDPAARHRQRPGLIEVCLDAYGWSGPWAGRRGFDSLVQMSSGIAAAGRTVFGGERPHPLPVQALDHATGYLMAAAALRGLARRPVEGGQRARLSLARTAALLLDGPAGDPQAAMTAVTPDDFAPTVETTVWGELRRLKPALSVAGVPMVWDRGASPLGSAPARWL